MRLSVKKWHRRSFGGPRKIISGVISWLVIAPLISLLAVTSSATQASANDCVVGSTQACPGASAAATLKVTKSTLEVRTQVRTTTSAKNLAQITLSTKAPARKLTLTNA